MFCVLSCVAGTANAIATTIAAGGAHTCAIDVAQAVYCWGNNRSGQLGDGRNVFSAVPSEVSAGPSGFVAVATGYSHTCGLNSSGGVLCWGLNRHGQLGDGTKTDSAIPLPVTGMSSGIKAISAAANYTCALTTAGAVACWGDMAWGQVGSGVPAPSSIPVPIDGLSSGIASISAGPLHTCALTTAGSVLCRGLNDYGQLGNGTMTGSASPKPVTGLSSGVIAISAGALHTCSLNASGGVLCWGSGPLGDGTNNASTIPVAVNGLSSGVAAISAGMAATCALTSAGVVLCWGSDSTRMTSRFLTVPTAIGEWPSGIGTIALANSRFNYSNSCAAPTSGGVLCRGLNDAGQLGNGTTSDRFTAVRVTGLATRISALSLGPSHACAVTAESRLFCWGANTYGQLGRAGA